MSSYPQILGVYSQHREGLVGTGGTTKRQERLTYWYVRQIDTDMFEVQSLNAHHVPSGVLTRVERDQFLGEFTPAPRYYHLHTLPALETLSRKLRMGKEAFAGGDLEEAERQFIKALMVDENNVDANFSLGEVYSESKNYERLKTVLDTLLGLNETFSFEHRKRFNQLGINLRKNGHYDQSIKYYKKCLEISASDEHLHFNLARAYYEKGQTDRCRASLETALELNPLFHEAKQFLHYCDGNPVVQTCVMDEF